MKTTNYLPRVRIWLLTALLISSTTKTSGSFVDDMAGKNVAVIIVTGDNKSQTVERNALTRMESILEDNNIHVLDKDKAEELSSALHLLDDPNAFITAETFIENADKFKIDGLLAVYLSTELKPGLGDYFTSTAHADIRFISEDTAEVNAFSTAPMGLPGHPPSDGLSERSALINAVQRAIDDAGSKLNLKIMDPATPRSIRLKLEPIIIKSELDCAKPMKEGSANWHNLAQLEQADWLAEKTTGFAKAPGKSLGAIATYVIDTNFQRRPPRMYGSRVHIINRLIDKETSVLTCFEVSRKQHREKGSRKIQDLAFLGSWRFLAVLTEGHIFLWDVETNRLLFDSPLQQRIKKAHIRICSDSKGSILSIFSKNTPIETYRISAQR